MSRASDTNWDKLWKHIRRYILLIPGAIVLAVATTVVNHWLERRSPPRMVVVQTEAPFHLETIRDDSPPFSYKLEYLGKVPETRFLGITSTPPGWAYEILAVNLTKTDQRNIEFTLRFTHRPDFLNIVPLHPPIRYKGAVTSSVLCLRRPDSPVVVYFDRLAAGTAKGLQIIFFEKDQPTIEDIQVSINCPEGKFQQITPIQWKRVGWK